MLLRHLGLCRTNTFMKLFEDTKASEAKFFLNEYGDQYTLNAYYQTSPGQTFETHFIKLSEFFDITLHNFDVFKHGLRTDFSSYWGIENGKIPDKYLYRVDIRQLLLSVQDMRLLNYPFMISDEIDSIDGVPDYCFSNAIDQNSEINEIFRIMKFLLMIFSAQHVLILHCEYYSTDAGIQLGFLHLFDFHQQKTLFVLLFHLVETFQFLFY